MNRIFTLAMKDVRLLLRDKAALFWVLGFPFMIAILFGSIFGGSNGPSRISVALVDQDNSKESQKLMEQLRASTALKVAAVTSDADPLTAAKEAVRKAKVSAYVCIPKGYGEEVRTFRYSTGPGIVIGMDPSHKAEGGMLQGVVAEASYKLLGDSMSQQNPQDMLRNIDSVKSSAVMSQDEKDAIIKLIQDSAKFNAMSKTGTSGGGGFKFDGPKITSDNVVVSGDEPSSPFEVTFPQAILWGILGVISSFVTSLVKEREQGTLTRLRASPLSLLEVLAGKGMACMIVCMGVIIVLLVTGHFAFGVRLPSPILAFAAIVCSAASVVGIMMLLSVLGRTEQAVSGASWGVMIVMAMFGGGMIPIFIMPGWMQTASNFSPLKWTTVAMEGAIWRGYSFQEMLLPCGILLGIGVVAFSLGVRVLKARLSGS